MTTFVIGLFFCADPASLVHRKDVQPTSVVQVDKAPANPPGGFVSLANEAGRSIVPKQSMQDWLQSVANDGWTRSARSDDHPLSPLPQWTHAGLDRLVELAQADASEKARVVDALTHLLRSGNSRGVLLAAVGLSQLGRTTGLNELSQTFVNQNASLVDRTMAMHALAVFPGRLDETSLRVYFHQEGQNRNQAPASVGPEADADRDALCEAILLALVRITGRRVHDPSEDAEIQAGLVADGPRTRRAAVLAYGQRPWPTVPNELIAQLRRESDPMVIRTALHALAARPTPAGRDLILGYATHSEPEVRRTSLETLGRFPHTPAVEQVLTAALKHESSLDRIAATKAAGKLQLVGHLMQACSDNSAPVREWGAVGLGDIPSEQSVRELQKLLPDRSIRVQRAAVESLAKMPADLAVPALLQAMERPERQTRRLAALAVGKIWPLAQAFIFDAPEPARRQCLASLREQWGQNDNRGPRVANIARSAPKKRRTEATGVDQAFAQQVREIVVAHRLAPTASRKELSQQLVSFGSRATPIIESVYESRNSFPDPQFLKEVLAPLDSTYAQLAELWAVGERDALAVIDAYERQWQEHDWTNVQAATLAEYARRCSRGDLWLRLTEILERNSPDEAKNLDAIGLAHVDPQVRAAVCDRVGSRRSAEQRWLLAKLLDDESLEVRLAALTALGKAGDPSLAPRLRVALHSAQLDEKLAAAVALYRLDLNDGLDALDELTRAKDVAVRERALGHLSACGKPGHSRVARILGRGLSDEAASVRMAALAGLEEWTGESFAKDSEGRPMSPAAQVEQWKRSLEAMRRETQMAN